MAPLSLGVPRRPEVKVAAARSGRCFRGSAENGISSVPIMLSNFRECNAFHRPFGRGPRRRKRGPIPGFITAVASRTGSTDGCQHITRCIVKATTRCSHKSTSAYNLEYYTIRQLSSTFVTEQSHFVLGVSVSDIAQNLDRWACLGSGPT